MTLVCFRCDILRRNYMWMLVTKNPRIKKSCFCRDLLHKRQSYHDSLMIWLPSINHFFLHITTYISHHCHHCWNLPLLFVMQDLLVHYCYHSLLLSVGQLLLWSLRYWYFEDSFWYSMPLLAMILTINLSCLNTHIHS